MRLMKWARKSDNFDIKRTASCFACCPFPLVIRSPLQSSPPAISAFKVIGNLFLQLLPAVLLKFPKHSRGYADKLVVKRLESSFESAYNQLPSIINLKILSFILLNSSDAFFRVISDSLYCLIISFALSLYCLNNL